MKNYISQKRIERGLTQRQLAQMCNITYQSLQRYENGSVNPSIVIALHIAKALDTTIDQLYQLDEND